MGWPTVASKKLEYGPRAIFGDFPSVLDFGVGTVGPSYSSFLESTVGGYDLQLPVPVEGFHRQVVPLALPFTPGSRDMNTILAWGLNYMKRTCFGICNRRLRILVPVSLLRMLNFAEYTTRLGEVLGRPGPVAKTPHRVVKSSIHRTPQRMSHDVYP